MNVPVGQSTVSNNQKFRIIDQAQFIINGSGKRKALKCLEAQPKKRRKDILSERFNNLTIPDSQKCFLCKVGFSKSHMAKIHLMSKHNEQPHTICGLCNNHIHKKNLKNHQLFHDLSIPNSRKCGECKLGFSRIENLRGHQKNVHSIKVSHCNDCDEQIKGRIKNHQLFHDLSIPDNHKCFECKSGFSSKDAAVAHLRNQHKVGHKTCEICDKIIKTKPDVEGITSHERYHEASLPDYLKCVDCEVGFCYLSDLRTHFREVHDIIKEIPNWEKSFKD